MNNGLKGPPLGIPLDTLALLVEGMTGMIFPFAGPTANLPEGWLACEGQSLSVHQYPKLFSRLGYTWGGSGLAFTLPDLRGQTLIGAGAYTDSSGAYSRVLAASHGATVHSLTAAEMPPHTHTYTQASSAGLAGGGSSWPALALTAGVDTGSAGGSGGLVNPHNNMQPSKVINYVIKT